MAAFDGVLDGIRSRYHKSGGESRKVSPALHNKDSRVVIVGGGAGGVHMACLLKQAGYRNIKIIESGPQLGGKCFTRMADEVPYELGFMLNVISEGPNALARLVEEYGLEDQSVAVGEGSWWGGDKRKGALKMNRYDSDNLDEEDEDEDGADGAGRVADADGKPAPLPTKGLQHDDFRRSVSDLGSKIRTAAFSDLPPLKRLLTRRISDIKLQVAQFFGNEPLVAAAKRYTALHRRLLGAYTYGMPAKPKPEVAEQLKCSFADLLRKHDMLSLIPVFILCPIAFSYHFLLELPAFYGLWWYNPTRVTALIDFRNGSLKLPHYVALKCGYQALWNKMAEDNQLSTLLNTSVKSIRRPAHAGNVGQLVAVQAGSDKPVTHEFDVLVLACNLKTGVALLENPTEEEARMAAALREFTLCSTVYESDVRPGERPIELFPFPKRSNAFGQVFAQVTPRLIVAPKEGPSPNVSVPEKERRVVYQFLSRSPRVEDMGMLKRRLKMYFDDVGIAKPVVLKQCPWKWFTHFSSEDVLQQGWPWRLQQMQGQEATLYVGASACFDSVNEILMHNTTLLSALRLAPSH